MRHADAIDEGYRRFGVGWVVGARAYSIARHGESFRDPGLMRVNRGSVSLWLDVFREPQGLGRYTLTSMEGCVMLTEAQGPAPVWVQHDTERGLLHLDVPGACRATFAQQGEGGWRVLYAQSPLLADLGVAGGRYEISGGRVERAAAGAETARPAEPPVQFSHPRKPGWAHPRAAFRHAPTR